MNDPCQVAVAYTLGNLLNIHQDFLLCEGLVLGFSRDNQVEQVSSVREVHDDVKNITFLELALDIDDKLTFELKKFLALRRC